MTLKEALKREPEQEQPFAVEKGLEYYYPFINQYIKVPNSLKQKIDTDYSKEREGVRRCIGIVLTNLGTKGVVAYSRRNEYYSKHGTKHYTYNNMLSAVKYINRIYAFTSKGYRAEQYDTGISSILHPMEQYEQLKSLAGNNSDIEYIDFNTIPIIQIDKQLIYNKWDVNKYVRYQINNSSNSIAISHSTNYSSIPSHNGTNYSQIFSETRTLNRKYFNKIQLGFSRLTNLRFQPLHQVSLTRIFNDGEGGRWFQKGGLSYQQLSKGERILILINGNTVEELDYSAMHPHLLYVWEGQQCPTDFYERIAIQLGIPYTDDTKFVIKRVALSSINASSELKLQQSISMDKKDELKANTTRRNEGRKERPILFDELKQLNLDFKQIVIALRQAHPVISKYIYSNSANKLMLDESNIMTSVLVELMDKKIPSVPIHDSLLFPQQHREVVKLIMLSHFQKATGFNINIK
jgi:hypothetical protein